MSTFTIGRVGVDVANGGDGNTLNHPLDWSQAGRQVTLRGIQKQSSDNAATWLVEQILGLDPANNPDEEWVPITSATVPELNGYFRVLSAQAVLGQGSLGTGTGIVQWQVVAERARIASAPTVQVPTIYAGMTNTVGVVTASNPQLMLALPSGYGSTWGVTGTAGTRAGENGTSDIFHANVAIPSNAQVTLNSYVPPANYYTAASYVDRSGFGQAVGRSDGVPADGWRIGNGLIRVQSVSGATFTASWWTGSAWTTATSFTVSAISSWSGSATTGATLAFKSVQVLRNAPDECVVRLTASATYATGPYPVTVDVSVRRGDKLARIYVSGATSSATFGFTSTTACTAITGGLRSTAVVNTRYVTLTSDKHTSTSTANGTLTASAPSGGKCMFAVGGATATTGSPDGAAQIALQGFVIYGSTQLVVVG